MSTPLSRLFGARVTRARTRLGWSRAELGRKAGISAKNIGGYEDGSNQPGIVNARKLADALGESLDDLTAPSPCGTCDGDPPPPFTCPGCGAGGTAEVAR